MTRKEEREQAARIYINSNAVAPECMQLAYGDFIEGARWADKTVWKPSDEQMEALDSAIDEFDGYPEYDSLVSLKKDLEKLKRG